MPESPLAGSFRILFLYDVCEEIRTPDLRQLAGARPIEGPVASPSSPEYIRFERPPLVQDLGTVMIHNAALPVGGTFAAELNYYEYGVVSLKLEVPFTLTWQELAVLSNKWINAPQLEAEALRLVRQAMGSAASALVHPNAEWLSEDYYIIHLRNDLQPDGSSRFRAPELLAERGGDIARIVRGELTELSDDERREILASQMSYYPHDLLVAGWNAAFLCDSSEGALPTVRLLEYANTQLLEFRYYDALLTRVLERVHHSLGRRGPLGRWKLAREAQNLNRIRLDVRELTEKMDASIKFLSDMFSARQYHVAANRIGVDDYRRLVDSKLHTAGDLYSFMMDQFNASRGFVLELIVVIILVVELILILRGEM